MKSSSGNQPRAERDRHHLNAVELHRLTLYKWRYTLESLGFRGWQVNELMFLAWLRATSRVHG